jgi:hypothetical protein
MARFAHYLIDTYKITEPNFAKISPFLLSSPLGQPLRNDFRALSVLDGLGLPLLNLTISKKSLIGPLHFSGVSPLNNIPPRQSSVPQASFAKAPLEAAMLNRSGTTIELIFMDGSLQEFFSVSVDE